MVWTVPWSSKIWGFRSLMGRSLHSIFKYSKMPTADGRSKGSSWRHAYKVKRGF
jgi:hypothetical protein